MNSAQGYSLWLMPSGKIYAALADIISDLSNRFSTPPFQPHITLLGGLVAAEAEILLKASRLSSLSPFDIRLSTVGFLNQYFKCLFVRVEETTELTEARVKATVTFNWQQDSPYMPHLSLLYGNLAPAIKQQIAAELEFLPDLQFQVNSIHLFATEGSPQQWLKIEEFALKRK